MSRTDVPSSCTVRLASAPSDELESSSSPPDPSSRHPPWLPSGVSRPSLPARPRSAPGHRSRRAPVRGDRLPRLIQGMSTAGSVALWISKPAGSAADRLSCTVPSDVAVPDVEQYSSEVKGSTTGVPVQVVKCQPVASPSDRPVLSAGLTRDCSQYLQRVSGLPLYTQVSDGLPELVSRRPATRAYRSHRSPDRSRH